jgi:hypothetical protein
MEPALKIEWRPRNQNFRFGCSCSWCRRLGSPIASHCGGRRTAKGALLFCPSLFYAGWVWNEGGLSISPPPRITAPNAHQARPQPQPDG